MTISLFNMNGAEVNISASTSSASQAINAPGATTVRICNTTNAVAYVRSGDSTVSATANDTPILAGTVEVFAINPGDTHVAAILASGTGTVNFLFGAGAL